MNTKIFLLLLCLLTTNHTASVVAETIIHTQTAIAEHTAAASVKTKETSVPVDLSVPEHTPDADPKHADKPHREHEDGKHHSFHFSRIPATKRRNLIVIAGKIALTFLHICVFLYCFMHVFPH